MYVKHTARLDKINQYREDYHIRKFSTRPYGHFIWKVKGKFGDERPIDVAMKIEKEMIQRIKTWDLQNADDSTLIDYLNCWDTLGFMLLGRSIETDNDICGEPIGIAKLVIPEYTINAAIGLKQELSQEEKNGIWFGIGKLVSNLEMQARRETQKAVVFDLYDYDDFAVEFFYDILQACGIETCTVRDETKLIKELPVEEFVVE
jgi:hypothetical protein